MKWDEDDGTIEGAVRLEQFMLWSDMAIAVRSAIPEGAWSMQCENLASRIVRLAGHVGPVPWNYIQIPLLRSGVYQRILDQARLAYPPIDWAKVHWASERWRTGVRP